MTVESICEECGDLIVTEIYTHDGSTFCEYCYQEIRKKLDI
jgi:formylmethanofuran dehydrogenase subunit E